MSFFKRTVTIDDLNAIATKYSKPLTVKDIGSISLIPSILMFFIVYTVSFNIFYSLIGFGIGMFYGLMHLLPKHVQRKYFLRAAQERNRFINSLASILNNDGTLTTKGIEIVSERLQKGGELRTDVEILVSDAKHGSEEKMKRSYKTLIEKNKDDRIFVQFVEQLLTASLIGRNNTDSLDSLAKYHDVVMREQDIFINEKKSHLTGSIMLVVTILACIFILALVLQSQGTYHYFDEGPGNLIVKSSLVIFLAYSLHLQCVNRYYDDSLQTLRK